MTPSADVASLFQLGRQGEDHRFLSYLATPMSSTNMAVLSPSSLIPSTSFLVSLLFLMVILMGSVRLVSLVSFIHPHSCVPGSDLFNDHYCFSIGHWNDLNTLAQGTIAVGIMFWAHPHLNPDICPPFPPTQPRPVFPVNRSKRPSRTIVKRRRRSWTTFWTVPFMIVGLDHRVWIVQVSQI